MTHSPLHSAFPTRVVLCCAMLLAPASIRCETVTLTPLGEIPNLRAAEIEASPWGIQFNGTPFHDGTAARWEAIDVEVLKSELPGLIEHTLRLGVKWARVSVDWPLVQDGAGDFHWELFDLIINGLVDGGITVYPSLHAGHNAFTAGKAPLTNDELEAWLVFATRVVERYREQIDYWEIWNEPNTVWFWPKPVKAEDYFRLVEASSRMISRVDPGAKVVGGSLARLDVPYARELVELGIGDYIDAFSFHPYGVFPEAAVRKIEVQVRAPLLYEPLMNPVSELREILDSTGKKIAVWQGECGYPSAMNSMGWNGTGPYGETIQAKWLLRRMLTDLSFGAQVSAYFMLKDKQNPRGDRTNTKGLLSLHGNSQKLAYRSFQNLCASLNGEMASREGVETVIEILEDGGLPGIQPKDTFSYVMETPGATYIPYWGITHLQENITPGRVRLRVKGLGQASSVDLIDCLADVRYRVSGYQDEASELSLEGLPLTDYPLILCLNHP